MNKEQLQRDLERIKSELKKLNMKNRIGVGRGDKCIICKRPTSSNTDLCLTHLSERNNTRDNHLANHRLFVFAERVNIE